MTLVCRLPSLAFGLMLLTAQAVSAQEPSDTSVVLHGLDGAASLNGDLVSYDDATFVIQTRIGEFSIARTAVTCEGAACPANSPPPTAAPPDAPAVVANDTLRFNLDAVVTDPHLLGLLQAMTTGFAQGAGLNALSVPSPGGKLERIEVFSGLMEGIGESGMSLATMDRGESLTAVSEGLVSLALDSGGAGLAEGLGKGPDHKVIALDALVPLVHPSNPVRAATIGQLAHIITGRITNWAEIGGPDREIRVILPPVGSALDDALTRLVLEPNRVRLRRSIRQVRMAELDAIAAVESDPAGLILTGITAVSRGRILPIQRICGPIAVPTPFAIKSEDYPLTRRIMSYHGLRDYGPTETAFLDYLSSDAAQGAIRQLGFVDQSVVTAPLSAEGGRLAAALLSAEDGLALSRVQDLTRLLISADRLSTTFRFQDGSLELDEKSSDDLRRVIDFLSSPGARDKRVLVLGFSDTVGRFDLNTNRALLKAKSVYSALLETPGGDTLEGRTEILTFGPLAPVGCNETAQGRAANRRVEIWLL